MTNRAAIYLRISLDTTGEGLAVERQREDCEKIAAARGWTVVETYIDNSISASKRNVRRPAYDRMVSDFGTGSFDALICYDLDRLTRQPRQLEDWIDAAEDRGLLLVTANGEADLTTDGGRMYARIKASVARAEVDRKSARQTRAGQQRADNGKVPSGVRLTGYTIKGDIVSDEAQLIGEIFEQFSAGESLMGIARRLNEAGVLTRRNGAWSPSTIYGLLRNPRYAGRAIYQGSPTGKLGDWQAIVSEGLFDVVQARLNDPRRVTNREGTERKHLGSGLYRCGVCGGPIRTNGTRYWCPVGSHVLRSQDRIDGFVIDVIRQRLSRPDFEIVPTPLDNDGAVKLDDQAQALRDRLAVIEADYDADLIDGRRYSVASAKIQAEIRGLEVERAKVLAGSAVAAILASGNPLRTFDEGTLALRRTLIDGLAVVTLFSAPRGIKTFDPSSVKIDWKIAR